MARQAWAWTSTGAGTETRRGTYPSETQSAGPAPVAPWHRATTSAPVKPLAPGECGPGESKREGGGMGMGMGVGVRRGQKSLEREGIAPRANARPFHAAPCPSRALTAALAHAAGPRGRAGSSPSAHKARRCGTVSVCMQVCVWVYG